MDMHFSMTVYILHTHPFICFAYIDTCIFETHLECVDAHAPQTAHLSQSPKVYFCVYVYITCIYVYMHTYLWMYMGYICRNMSDSI